MFTVCNRERGRVMEIFPAIDLIDGKCVRLVQGDYTQKTTYEGSPLEMAQLWEDKGAKYLHIVDLEGAKKGLPCHLDIVESLVQSLSIPIQVGGGIRTLETIERYKQIGVDAVILGTIALKDVDLLKESIRIYGDFIRVGVDIRDGVICTEGWLQSETEEVVPLLHALENMGLASIVCTDICQDGMLSGINPELYKTILDETEKMRIVIAGGVTSVDDIKNIQNLEKKERILGVIVGKALYENAVSLDELLVCMS